MKKVSKIILLVEDNAIIALNQKKQLENRGYTVVHLLNGEKAIEQVKTKSDSIDLVLMDIDLGRGLDGPKTAMEILKIKEIPVVFLSSHTESDIVEKTESITSYGYVVKNSGITVLDASIKMAFKLFTAYKNIQKHESSLEEVNESLIRLEKAIETTKDIVFITNKDEIISYINPQFTEVYGYTKEETVGKMNPRILTEKNTTEKENDEFWEVLLKKKHLNTQFTNKSKNGKLITVEATIDPLFDKNGNIKGFVQIQRDITTHIHAEKKILVSNKYLDFIDSISNDQAHITSYTDLINLIMKQLKKISNSVFVSFTVYDKKNKLLKNMKLSAAKPILNSIFKIAGKKILNIEIPISDDYYTIIANNRIRLMTDLAQLSQGTLDSKMTSRIEKSLGIDKIFGISFFFGKKLYGTSLITLKKGQQEPDKELLKSFIKISSISLHRLSPPNLTGDTSYLKDKESIQIDNRSKFCLDAFNSMDLGLFLVNSDYSVKFMNDTMIKWFGDQTNQICYNSLVKRTKPCPNCQINSDNDNKENYSTTTKDGRTYSIKGSLLQNADGSVSKLELIQDITEIISVHQHVENLLQEKEIILKEVHHRIKNNMMTLMGLLTLQEQSLDDKTAITAFENTRNRVKSMMVLYDKLYKSNNYQTIWIKDYLETILKEIIECFTYNKTIDLNCNIEDIQMEPGLVFNLGIIINELITNSMKYAANNSKNIAIYISVLQIDDLIIFTIKDNGQGFPDTENIYKSGGFGLELVRILSEQILADISFSNDNGAKIVLKLRQTLGNESNLDTI